MVGSNGNRLLDAFHVPDPHIGNNEFDVGNLSQPRRREYEEKEQGDRNASHVTHLPAYRKQDAPAPQIGRGV